MINDENVERGNRSHWPISILSSLSALVNMFVPLILVRVMSPEQVGEFKIFFLYLIMIPALSLTTGLVNGLAYWAGKGEPGLKAIQVSNGLTVTVGAFLAVICFLAAPFLSYLLNWDDSITVLFAVSVFGMVCLNFFEESCIVTGRIWIGAAYLAGGEVVRSLAIIIVGWISKDLTTIILAATAVSIAKAGVGVLLGMRIGLVAFEMNAEVVKGIWRYSFPVSVALLFGLFVSWGDQLVLANILSPAEFAVYALGCLSIPPLLVLEQSVTRVLIPQMSHAFHAGKGDEAAQFYREAVEQLALILIPATVGLVVFAGPIIELLFTSRYSAASEYLRWFAVSYLLLIVPHDSVPRARGESRWIFKTYVAFSILPLALCYGLGMKYAAFGALAGILVSRMLMKVYSLWYICHSTKWRIGQFIPLWNIGVFTAVSVGLGIAVSMIGSGWNAGLKGFLVSGGAFVCAYFPAVLFLTNWRRRRLPMREGETRRVLLFSQHLSVGGLERMVLMLSQALQSSGRWRVFVFSHDSDETAESYSEKTLIEEFLKAGIPVDALRKGRGISFLTLFRLVKNVYENRIDVIHSHDMGTLLYAVLANILSLGRVRLVHTQHSFVHLQRFRRYSLYERIFVRFVDVLTVVSESMVQSYVELGVPRESVQVVNNGVEFMEEPVLEFPGKLKIRRRLIESLAEDQRSDIAPFLNDRWLLYLARLHSVKGQREVAEVWKLLKPEFRKTAILILMGPEAERGEKEKVLRAFEGAPDRERVLLFGGTKAPREWLAASDLFLSCSRIEGMPLGPLEAIGSGLPAVLSEIGGHRFLSSVSRQYRLESPSDGAAAIERLISDPAFGTRDYYLGLWRRSQWIRKRFSLGEMAERYAAFYAGRLERGV